MKKLLALCSCLLLLGLTAAAPADGPATTGEHRVRTPDGIEIWYRVAGVNARVPVIFVHGGPGEGSQAMQALAGPALERRVRMVYFDQRGSGQSERPKDRKFYSMALVESDIETIRRAIGTERVVVLAHSAGTPIALEYAADHPDHVRGLILTGAVPDMPAVIAHLCDRIHELHPELYANAVAAAAGRGNAIRSRRSPMGRARPSSMRTCSQTRRFATESIGSTIFRESRTADSWATRSSAKD